MRYQAFRQKSTGALTNAIFTTAGDSFDANTTESRRLDIAAATGIPASDLEAIDQPQAPARSRQTIVLPVPPPSPQDEARDRVLSAIAVNRGEAPWGAILYDLAIADGRITT
jgi:hypothetical protein